MSDYYPTTAVPFDGMPLPALRDPVLAGMGTVGDVGAAADEYRTLADTLEKAAEDLRVVMDGSQDAHEGEAAAASRHYVMRIAAVGELGAAQARISMDSLQQGISYFTRARDDMTAIPRAEEEQLHDPRQAIGKANRVEEARILAVEAMQRYESNTNFSFERQFQPFEPEPIAPPGAIGGGPGGGPGVGSGTSGVGGPAGGASAAGAGTGVAASEFAGPAAGPGSIAGAGGGAGSAGPAGTGGGSATGTGSAPGSVAAGAVPGGVGAGGGAAGGVGAGGGATGGAGGAAAGGAGAGGRGAGAGPGRAGSGAAGTGPGGTGGGATAPGRGGAGALGGAAGRPATVRPASEGPDAGRHRTPDGDGRYPAVGRKGAGTGGSGWVPGTPWSSRPGAGEQGAGAGGSGGGAVGGYAGRGAEEPHTGNRGAAPTTGPGAAAGQAGRGAGGAPGYGGAPMMGGAGAGNQGETHTRPSWLLEDDPEAFWFKGMPDYGPPVIGGEDDY